MKLKTAMAALAGGGAPTLPAQGLGYPTWFEFARQSNAASTLTMVWYLGPEWYGTQSWRAGAGVSPGAERAGSGAPRVACGVGDGLLQNGYYDRKGHWDNCNGGIGGSVFYLQNKQFW